MTPQRQRLETQIASAKARGQKDHARVLRNVARMIDEGTLPPRRLRWGITTDSEPMAHRMDMRLQFIQEDSAHGE